MFCSNCGKNIPDGTNVCPECGQPSLPQRPVGSAITMSSAKDKLGSLTDRLKCIPARLVAKIALLAAIVCFAFPFVTISCDMSDFGNSMNQTTGEDYSMEVTYKGYNFIFPSTVDDDNTKVGSGFNNSVNDDEDDSDSDSSDREPSGLLIAVVICCAAGTVLLFIKKSEWLPAISALLSFVGVICLSRFKSTFADKYLTAEESGVNIENFLDIDFRFGYSLCMLFLLIAMIACTITFLTDKFRYDKNF